MNEQHSKENETADEKDEGNKNKTSISLFFSIQFYNILSLVAFGWIHYLKNK